MGGFLGIKARSDHRFAADNLSPYLDGRLTPQEKERLERHLTACPDCRQELSTLRETVALLHRAPMRPVPRSFTLPVSVQAEQAQHRRWNMTHSFMRVATVVVSLLLVIVVSGDVLLGQGVIGIPDLYGPRAAKMAEGQREGIELQAAQPQEGLTADQATPEVQPTPDVQALQAPAEDAVVAGDGEKALEGGGESAMTAEAQPGAMLAAPNTAGEQDGVAAEEVAPEGAPQQGAPIARSMGTTPASEAAPEEQDRAAGSPEATAASDAAASTEAETAPEEPVALAQAAPEVQAAPEGQAAPAEEPQPTPEAMAKQEAASPATEGEQAPEVYGEADGQNAPERGAEALTASYDLSPVWTVWQMLRLIALVLGGLLMVLIGGLLWSGHKRQL